MSWHAAYQGFGVRKFGKVCSVVQYLRVCAYAQWYIVKWRMQCSKSVIRFYMEWATILNKSKLFDEGSEICKNLLTVLCLGL